MGKFSRNREYTFASLEEIISSVIEEFDDGANVDIVVPWKEVHKIISAIIPTGKFTIYLLDYESPEMDGYCYEYNVGLSHLDDNALFVEKIYDKERNKYVTFCDETSDVVFVSADVSKVCYDEIVEDGCNTVLFDIEN